MASHKHNTSSGSIGSLQSFIRQHRFFIVALLALLLLGIIVSLGRNQQASAQTDRRIFWVNSNNAQTQITLPTQVQAAANAVILGMGHESQGDNFNQNKLAIAVEYPGNPPGIHVYHNAGLGSTVWSEPTSLAGVPLPPVGTKLFSGGGMTGMMYATASAVGRVSPNTPMRPKPGSGFGDIRLIGGTLFNNGGPVISDGNLVAYAPGGFPAGNTPVNWSVLTKPASLGTVSVVSKDIFRMAISDGSKIFTRSVNGLGTGFEGYATDWVELASPASILTAGPIISMDIAGTQAPSQGGFPIRNLDYVAGGVATDGVNIAELVQTGLLNDVPQFAWQKRVFSVPTGHRIVSVSGRSSFLHVMTEEIAAPTPEPPAPGGSSVTTVSNTYDISYQGVSVHVLGEALNPGGSVVAGLANVTSGGQARFTMTVNNPDLSAKAVDLRFDIPTGFTFVSSSVAPTGQTGQRLTWSNFQLPSGQANTVITIDVQAP